MTILPQIRDIPETPDMSDCEDASSARWVANWYCSSPGTAIGGAITAHCPRQGGRLTSCMPTRGHARASTM